MERLDRGEQDAILLAESFKAERLSSMTWRADAKLQSADCL
jgi:hypothetical protein